MRNYKKPEVEIGDRARDWDTICTVVKYDWDAIWSLLKNPVCLMPKKQFWKRLPQWDCDLEPFCLRAKPECRVIQPSSDRRAFSRASAWWMVIRNICSPFSECVQPSRTLRCFALRSLKFQKFWFYYVI